MSDAYSAIEQARLRREQQAGNSTRPATVALTYGTNGVGESVTTGPLAFGCAFISPPVVATGCIVHTLPDVTRYRYPIVTAGVMSWDTRPTSDPASPLYVGARLFFTVQCDPRTLLRTDGTDLAYQKARLAALQQGTPEYNSVQLAVAEAQLALDLKANPPKVSLEHHLTFSGVATQTYSLDERFTRAVIPIPVQF